MSNMRILDRLAAGPRVVIVVTLAMVFLAMVFLATGIYVNTLGTYLSLNYQGAIGLQPIGIGRAELYGESRPTLTPWEDFLVWLGCILFSQTTRDSAIGSPTRCTPDGSGGAQNIGLRAGVLGHIARGLQGHCSPEIWVGHYASFDIGSRPP